MYFDRRSVCSCFGFTIVELLLVMILLATVAGLALPNFSQAYAQQLFRKSAEDLAYTMRYAQVRAMSQGRVHELKFNPSEGSYWLTRRSSNSSELEPVFEEIGGRMGRKQVIPSEIKFDSGHAPVRFYPNGSIDKRRLYLTYRDQVITVSSAEQRGQVRIVDFKI